MPDPTKMSTDQLRECFWEDKCHARGTNASKHPYSVRRNLIEADRFAMELIRRMSEDGGDLSEDPLLQEAMEFLCNQREERPPEWREVIDRLIAQVKGGTPQDSALQIA